MGYDCKLYAHDNSSNITIGDRVSLNENVLINADDGSIVIGGGSIIGPNTVLRTLDHIFTSTDIFFRDQGNGPGVIQIGENVWLGLNEAIFSKVEAYGVPAKIIREI